MAEQVHRELVRAVAAGDRAAWAELYRTCLPVVLRWCLHAIRDGEAMNDYFDQFEQSMGAALERGAHRPWYARVGRIPHGRAFAAVFGALVIGAPAGAVSNCFGACVPVHAKVTVNAGHSPQPPAADAGIPTYSEIMSTVKAVS